MKKSSIFLAVSLVTGAVTCEAQMDINGSGTESGVTPPPGGVQSHDQPVLDDPFYTGFSTNEDALAAVLVPESPDYTWAAGSFLMVCALATTLRNSYRRAI
jgi:hypothetical protein